MWTTVALVVTVLVILILRANKRPAGLPPGPFTLPFVGNVISILASSQKNTFKQFVKDYGGILSFKIFNSWTVLVSDPALMRTSLADKATTGRIDLLLFNKRDILIKGKKNPPLGIISTSGDVWKHQRRFTLRTLKDLGFGRNTLEPIMQAELEELLHLLSKKQGEKVNVGLLFHRSIVNILWAITIGKRYTYDDTNLETLVQKVNMMLKTYNPFHPALRFPWLKKLFPNLSILRTTEGYMADLLVFIEGEMEVYRQQMAGQVDTGSYIGAYLHEMDQLKPEEGDDTALSSNHLKANILELFLAGSDTTSSTLCWAVYLLAANPKVQRTMQEEMDQVVGRDNLPTLAHMDKLTYTMATIYEVQRMSDIVPFGISHRTIEDVTIGGYRIPKDTAIIFNLSHALSDPKYWKEPETFRPEHFLTEDGKLYKPDHFIPFSSGKRVCLGESLARLEVFLFLASLMHAFSWRLSDDPVVWEKSFVINKPPTFSVYAVCRQERAVKE